MTTNEVAKMFVVIFFCLIGLLFAIAIVSPTPQPIRQQSNVLPYKVEPTTTITAKPAR